MVVTATPPAPAPGFNNNDDDNDDDDNHCSKSKLRKRKREEGGIILKEFNYRTIGKKFTTSISLFIKYGSTTTTKNRNHLGIIKSVVGVVKIYVGTEFSCVKLKTDMFQ